MSLSLERKPKTSQKTEMLPRYLKEAIEDKEALSHIFSKKAFETKDEKLASMYYLIASFLRNGEVRPFNRLMATDGENFYVGPAYLAVKKKYGKKIVPFLWLHEVMHIIHAHPKRMKLVPDKELYNIVADLYINNILEKRLGKIPDDFVTLTSFIKFIIDERGRDLSPDEREALKKLAKLVLQEKITVEEAYAVIENIPVAKQEFKERFKNSSFFGSDMGDEQELTGGSGRGGGENKEEKETGKQKDKCKGGKGKGDVKGASTPTSKGSKEKESGGKGGKDKEGKEDEEKKGKGTSESRKSGKEKEEGGKGEGRGDEKPQEGKEKEGKEGEGGREEEKGESKTGDVEELERNLKTLREHLDKLIGKVKQTMGEFNALRRVLGAPPGNEEGVFGRAEYEEIQNLRVELEKELLEEIGREVREYEVNYSRFSDDAYWLPEDRELFRRKIVVFLDTSGSIPEPVAKLFMNWVNKAVKKYGLEADVVVFAVGVLEKHKGVSTSKKLKNVALGGGTYWDKSVADEIIRAKKEDVPLIIVLSDMMIGVSNEAWQAIRLYKRHGGKISCWTVGTVGKFCDKVHRFPRTFRAIF